MEAKKIIEEKSKNSTEILVTLFKSYTNATRVNNILHKKSSWIKCQISKLRNAEYLEDEKFSKNGGHKPNSYRLRVEFIFYHLKESGLNKKEKSYLIKLINRHRRDMAIVPEGDKLFLNVIRICMLLLDMKLQNKRKNSRLIKNLAKKILLRASIYGQSSPQFSKAWDELFHLLVRQGSLTSKELVRLEKAKGPIY